MVDDRGVVRHGRSGRPVPSKYLKRWDVAIEAALEL